MTFPFPNLRRVHVMILLAVSILLRIAFHHTYLPWWAGDSAGYALPAWAIYTGHLDAWDGARTPGYPLYLLASELLGGQVAQKLTPMAGQIVTWGQSLLGVVSVILVYFTMERLLIRSGIRFAFALFYAVLVPVAEFEMIILSDFLCLFFTTVAVYFMAVTVDRLRRGISALAPAILAGVACAAALLVRPNGIFLWVFFLGALFVVGFFRRADARSTRKAIWRACLGCAVSGGLLVAAWLIFNFENTGALTLTPITGMARTSAAYNLFDKVHVRDKLVGDIMVKYYLRSNPPGIVARDYVNAAFPEILQHYAEMPVHQPPGSRGTVYMCEYLGYVSDYLLREHPQVWLDNTIADLRRTTDFNFPQAAPDMVTDPAALSGGTVVVNIPLWKFWLTAGRWEAWPILLTYLLTYATIVIGAFRVLRSASMNEMLLSLLPVILSSAAIVCMVAFCALATYFNRYSLSLLPIFLICSAYSIESAFIFARSPLHQSTRD